ncbi:MAG: hypothetical protein KDN19_05575 [Verrucomicrobiae bacterium]|nr:hypothetical protein [Verrucomicrobiae bacterium]
MNPHASLPGSGPSSFQGYPTLDLEGLIRSLRKRIFLIGGIFGFCILLALIYAFLLAPKKFQSTAVVYVEREQVLNDNIRGVLNDDFSKLDSLKSLERSIVSGGVILKVVDDLGLRDDPDFLKPKSGGKEYSDAEIVEIVSRRVKATLERGTRLILIEVTDKSPTRARDMAKAFVNAFEAHVIEQNFDSAQKATAMLREQAEKQRENVDAAEDELQRFRESHPDVTLEEGGITEKELEDLNRLVSDAKNERLRLEAQAMKLDAIGTDDPEAILEIGDYAEEREDISKLLLARNTKRAEMAKIRKQFQPDHPTYQSFVAELEGLEEEVAEVGRNVGESIRKRLETAREHEKQLIASVAEQKREVLSVDRVRKEFRELKQRVSAANDTYYALLARINETDVTEGVKESIIRMEEAPLIPSKPSSPKKKVILALAGAMGLFLGFGTALLLYLLDRSLRTRRQIEQTLGLPVLAEISHSPEASQEDLRESLVVFSEPHSLASESFRSLRTSLSTLSPRSVLVTSAMPGDGKSFCAANLALLQAQLGFRTLLVDADFRRPSLANALMYRYSDPEAEDGALDVMNTCQRTPFPNLYLINCAQFAPNSGEAMSGEHFAGMLWEAYRSFDCVIIDTSPLCLVSDALNFARYADAVALVVRSGKTQTGDAQHACRELRRLRVPLAGCILNGIADETRSKAYFETYHPAANQRPKFALPNSTPSA